ALAVALTVALFKTIGPKRTRLVAQIFAAMIGAAFVIGLQVGAILSFDTLSRIDFLKSDMLVALAPGAGSIVYWPARATLGAMSALAAVLSIGVLLLIAAMLLFSPRFGDHAIAAASVAMETTRGTRGAAGFRTATPMRVLRHKEWTLLLRDPWL